MSFKGIFIGINKYQSKRICELSCAVKDATSIYSLFQDTLGGNCKLITNEKATKEYIETELNSLKNSSTEDTIIIYFSGHGSTTQELVVFDSDPKDIIDSSIPLSFILNLFNQIHAKQIIIFLDCCFSGISGSKGLKPELLSRDLFLDENILEKLSGKGRLVFSASGKEEPAWEYVNLGHGFFTYHLLEALQGQEQVIENGSVSLYKLFNYVSEKVKDSALLHNKKQHPTINGDIEESVKIPILTKGQTFFSHFPELNNQVVTDDIFSLKNFGFSDSLLNNLSKVITTFKPLQVEAINKYGVLSQKHLLVSAPTSSGKTFIGELAALRSIMECKKSIFLFPLKALVNDKYQYFNKVYSDIGIRTIKATGESADDIPDLMRGKYDICLMTYEKFTAIALGNPLILEQIGTIIIDEVQMLADKNRGVNVEFILTLLRIRRRNGIEPQLIMLSGVIGNTGNLEGWLDSGYLLSTERPIPLKEGIITYDCSFKYINPDTKETEIEDNYFDRQYIKNSNQDWLIPLVEKLVSEKKQVIIFRATKSEARSVAIYLSKALNLPPANNALEALPGGDLSNSSRALHQVLQNGIAFHISDLSRDERLVIEETFRLEDSPIRVIVATTTLAMGVNTPAEAVIIVGLEHPGNQPYSIAEYKNIVGRAGRLGFAKQGEAYLIAIEPPKEDYFWNNYVIGEPEGIVSRFFQEKTDIRTLIIRILASTARNTKGLSGQDIIDFLEGSFGAFQKKNIDPIWAWDDFGIITALESLESVTLIEKDENELYRLTKIGWVAGQAGIEVESIARIIKALQELSEDQLNDQTLIALTQLSLELNDVYLSMNKKGNQKEQTEWANRLLREGVNRNILNHFKYYIKEQTDFTLRCKKVVCCLFWLTDTPMSNMENYLSQFYIDKSLSGSINNVCGRTFDILPSVIKIAELIFPDLDLTQRGENLLARLEVGTPFQIVEIVKVIGNRLTRPDYLNLLNAQITDINTLAITSDEDILNILNDNNKLTIIREALENYSKEDKNLSNFFDIPLYKG